MFRHKVHTIILPPHRNTTVHFERYYFYCKLQHKLWQGTKRIITATVIPSIIFAACYLCSVEYAVFWDRGREHYKTRQALTIWQNTNSHWESRETEFKHKDHTTVTEGNDTKKLAVFRVFLGTVHTPVVIVKQVLHTYTMTTVDAT